MNMRNVTMCIICLILIFGVVAIASASEAAKSHEPVREAGHGEVVEGGHEVVPEEGTHEVREGEHGEVAHEAEEGGLEAERHEAVPEGEHGETLEHEGEHGAPLVYWFFWIFALLAIAPLVQYTRNIERVRHSKRPTKYEATGYIVIILVFATSAILISMLPRVGEYHEPVIIGFGRFFLMAIVFLFLMIYGINEYVYHERVHD